MFFYFKKKFLWKKRKKQVAKKRWNKYHIELRKICGCRKWNMIYKGGGGIHKCWNFHSDVNVLEIWIVITGWWLTYDPSEKWWSSSAGIMTFHIWWKIEAMFQTTNQNSLYHVISMLLSMNLNYLSLDWFYYRILDKHVDTTNMHLRPCVGNS